MQKLFLVLNSIHARKQHRFRKQTEALDHDHPTVHNCISDQHQLDILPGNSSGTAQRTCFASCCSQEKTWALPIRDTHNAPPQDQETASGLHYLMHHIASLSFSLWFVGVWWEHFNGNTVIHRRVLVGRMFLNMQNGSFSELVCPRYTSYTTSDQHWWDSNSFWHLKTGCCRSIRSSDLPWTLHPVYIWGNA